MGAPARSIAAILLVLLVGPFLPVFSTVSWAADQGYTAFYTCNLTIVAVSSSGEGVASNLSVTVAFPGKGRVFISTSPASMIDTQGSARLAAFAASMLAGVDMTRYDFFYDIQSPSVIIGGPSAGFAMSLATLLALERVRCPSDVAVTGMIQPDASIGPVGGLKEKLEAAAAAGKTVFMIPAGQLVYTYYKTVYKRVGPIVYTVREPVTVNLSSLGEQLGVRVVPVASLAQAYEILTGVSIVPANLTLPPVPSPVREALANYTSTVLAKARSIATPLLGSESRVAKELASKALGYAANASNTSSELLASIYALQAFSTALAAQYAQWAYTNNTDVTGVVDRVNQTLTSAYQRLSSLQAATGISAELLAKAWSKLGVASYYYQEALQSLEREDGRYVLPSTLFAVDYTPVLLLARAEAFANWSLLWADASQLYNTANGSVPEAKLRRVANLLLDEARTMVAYTQVLLEESGAGAPGDADLAAWLVEQAIGSNRSLERIGYSIEAISAATAIIHDVFTIDVNETRDWVARTALAVLGRAGQDVQVPLLLGLAYSPGIDEKLSLQAASKAVLYAWLAQELPGGPGRTVTVPPPGPVSTAIYPTINPSGEREGPAGGPGAHVYVVLVAAAAAALAVALVAVAVRR